MSDLWSLTQKTMAQSKLDRYCAVRIHANTMTFEKVWSTYDSREFLRGFV